MVFYFVIAPFFMEKQIRIRVIGYQDTHFTSKYCMIGFMLALVSAAMLLLTIAHIVVGIHEEAGNKTLEASKE